MDIPIFANKIPAKVSDVDEEHYYIELHSGQVIKVKKESINIDLSKDDAINLYIGTDDMEKQGVENIAKSVLNNVFDVDNSEES